MISIFSIPLSKLNKGTADLNDDVLTKLLTDNPQLGKIAESHYIFNNNLTLNNPYNILWIQKLNIALQLSRAKGQLVQITKN